MGKIAERGDMPSRSIWEQFFYPDAQLFKDLEKARQEADRLRDLENENYRLRKDKTNTPKPKVYPDRFELRERRIKSFTPEQKASYDANLKRQQQKEERRKQMQGNQPSNTQASSANKTTIKLSRSQWESIGKKAGWTKSAGVFWGSGQGPQDNQESFETDKQMAIDLLKFNGKNAWNQISEELKKDPDIIALYQSLSK